MVSPLLYFISFTLKPSIVSSDENVSTSSLIIVEEASDLTKEEVIKLVTRLGKNARMTFAGDLRQAELKGDSGLHWLVKFVERHNLSANFGFVDFNDVNDIVRSDAVKQFITCLLRDEKKGIE